MLTIFVKSEELLTLQRTSHDIATIDNSEATYSCFILVDLANLIYKHAEAVIPSDTWACPFQCSFN